LSEQGVLEYHPPFKGTEVKILQRQDPEEINLDSEALEKKRKQAYQKLDKIEDYIYHSGCRQEFILNYFGDREAGECGKCDNCRSGPGERVGNQENRPAKKEKKKRVKLNTKLTQLETLDLYNKGLGIKEIAQERDLQESTIVTHLCYLIEKKLISAEEVDKLVDKKTQNRVKRAAKKVGQDKLKPIFEELGEKVSYEEIKLTLVKNK